MNHINKAPLLERETALFFMEKLFCDQKLFHVKHFQSLFSNYREDFPSGKMKYSR
jgi:hypothetical protein